MPKFNAAPLEQRIYGVGAPVDNRVIELIKSAENKVAKYFRKVMPKLDNVDYVITALPTYVQTGIERTKDGFRRYIKPVRKIMGAYTSRLKKGVKTILIDPMVPYEDHILRTGGYLPDGRYLYPIKVENPEAIVGHEDIHGYRADLGTHPERSIEEGITQFATEEVFPDAGGAYPLETEAVRRTMKKEGAGEVFYPTQIPPSKRRRIVDSFREHYNKLSSGARRLFFH